MAIKKTVAAAGRSAARPSTVPARAAKKAPSPGANKAARAQQPIAAEPTAAAPAKAPKASDLRIVSFAALQLGKNNPRKTYDPAALQQLADSIKVKGVQQSLLVREVRAGRYDVVAGQRRYRAVELLVAAGDWKNDEDRIPVLVGDLDDADALEAALVENNQREDINPMQEAEGFARLQAYDIKKYSSANIGARIGRTERFVEKRLALVRRLSEPAQKALREGKINTAQANALTVATKPAEQKEALRCIINGWGNWETEEEIRHNLLRDKPLMSGAFFERALYKGDVIADPDKPEQTRAEDRAQFERLQREAMDAKAKAWRAEGKTVEIFDVPKGQYYHDWEWQKAGAKDAGVTVIEFTRDLQVKVRHGMRLKEAERPARGSASSKKKKGDAPAYTKTHFAVSRRIKSEALQRAVAYDVHAAMKLVILSLLGTDIAAIRTNPRGREDLVTAPELIQTITGYLSRAGLKLRADGFRDTPFDLGGDGDRVARVWEEFGKVLSPDDVESLFAHVVASRFGSFSGFSPEMGDDPTVVAVAAELRVDMSDQPRQIVTDEWLESCRSPQLRELIEEAGIGAAVNTAGKGVQNMTQKALREGIKLARDQGLLAGYVPRTLRIGSAAELAKAPVARKKAVTAEPLISPAAEKHKAALADARSRTAAEAERRSAKSKAAKIKTPTGAAPDSAKPESADHPPPTKAQADDIGVPEHLRRPDLRDSEEPVAAGAADPIPATSPAEAVIGAAAPAIAAEDDLRSAPAGVVDPGEPPAFLKRARAS